MSGGRTTAQSAQTGRHGSNRQGGATMESTNTFGHRVMWVLWPAFLAAGAGTAIFFTVFDPFDLHFFGAPLELSREAIYTLGFFGFWALGAGSSALTVFLGNSPWEVNRCPLEAADRPNGCPKQQCAACGAVVDVPQRAAPQP
jgi:hypothetical protein